MNILRQKTNELESDPSGENTEYPLLEQRIGGYEGSSRSFIKEPSLYLSIAIIFITTGVCLANTPALFWVSSLSLSAVAVLFHILAERQIFRANKEFESVAVPFDGMFVLTFGAILPGLVMLAYGTYATTAVVERNIAEEAGKLALILMVPFFNFYVWSAVRRKFLARPRLVGTMNGLAIGLSSAWSVILMKLMLFSNGDPSCRFGWVLLLFMAPLMLFASICLSLDLWRRTEPAIGRITRTFTILGGLVSMLFVFTPLARGIFVQSLMTDAKQGSADQKFKAVSALRAIATPQDLRPSRNPVNGFSLASLLLWNRGLDSGSDIDKDAYFKITGRPYAVNANSSTLESDESPNVGAKVPGLALSKSQITGSINGTALTSSIDWTMSFHNSTGSMLEARGEIQLPKQAAVSRVTLWINGVPNEAAFSSTSKTSEAYSGVVARQRDPLLVTMPAPDRILFQCFPVPPNSKTKIRLGFKVPLQTADGKTCTMQLPKLLSTNFTQSIRHRIRLLTEDTPIQISGMVAQKVSNGYSLHGIVKSDGSSKQGNLVLKRTVPLQEMATPDWYSKNKQYIVQKLREVSTSAPARLFVVMDMSESLRNRSAEMKQMLAEIPASLKPIVYLVKEPATQSEIETPEAKEKNEQCLSQQGQTTKEQNAQEQSDKETSAPKQDSTDRFEDAESDDVAQSAADVTPATTKVVPATVKEAMTAMEPAAFIGGQDNHPVVREALESAAEAPDSAVLWIHGPQPLSQNLDAFTPLDLVHGVRLFDLHIGKGPNTVLAALEAEDTSRLILRKTLLHKSTTDDLESLLSDWSNGTKRLAVERTISTTRPQMTIIATESASAEVTALWAREEVARQQTAEHDDRAIDLASNYRLVTPISGAVVLENAKDYAQFKLNPGKWRADNPESFAPLAGQSYKYSGGGGGLVGAPVDPRYGQSNEVGSLADFGYDTVRDISRVVTAFSWIIAMVVAGTGLRASGAITSSRLIRAVVLVVAVPTVVHFIGTFAINNYGGLGGGL